MGSTAATTWDIDWFWSLPLIVMSVVIHVVGLMIIIREAVKIMSIVVVRCRFAPMFIVVMSMVAVLATVLQGLEGSYGHASLFLEDRWQLMGALEALNGTLLFGLTTAFLFAMIRELSEIERKERRRSQRHRADAAPE